MKFFKFIIISLSLPNFIHGMYQIDLNTRYTSSTQLKPKYIFPEQATKSHLNPVVTATAEKILQDQGTDSINATDYLSHVDMLEQKNKILETELKAAQGQSRLYRNLIIVGCVTVSCILSKNAKDSK